MANRVPAALTAAFAIGLTNGLTDGLTVGLAFALAVELMAGLVHPWGKFCLTRLLLAVRGHTPPRLMAFLREARDRGVLRQTGGVYQFRHNRLQDHLATGNRCRRRSG
jgi:hypothetical protein